MMRRRILPLLVAVLAGCGYYEAAIAPAAIPTPIAETDRFEVWSDGRATELWHLALDADTLRGVRFDMAATCDACRVAFARVEVDSVRRFVGEGDPGEYSKFFIGLIAIYLIVKAFPRPT